MNSQKNAFDKLSKLKVGALFMEMGTGKTKVALDLIASKQNKVDYILWICPYSLQGEIETERQKWHPELQLHIVGYESLGSSDRIYADLLEVVKSHKTFIVADESLKIKNLQAKRTQRVILLGDEAKYKLLLNGTPISKNCLDIWPQMEFLSHKILKMSYNQYKNTFCEYYLRGELKGIVRRQCNIPYLISLIEPYIYDAKLDLNKKKRYYDHHYDMDEELQAEYWALRDKCLDQINAGSVSDVAIMRMFQLLQGCYTQADEKNKKVQEIIAQYPDEQFVVFVKYVKSLDQNHISGDMDMEDREKVLKEFRSGNIRVLYLTYGVGAYGLNLQNCHNVIFAEHTFDYAQKIQAAARVYRIGQKNNVTYHNLWCDCGMEDLIKRSLQKKTNLLTEVKLEISRKGGAVSEWLKNI